MIRLSYEWENIERNSELKHEVKFVCKAEIIAVCLLILIAFLWSGISLGWADLLHGVSLQTRTSVTLRDFTIMSGYSMQTQLLPSTKLPKLLFANYPTTAQLVNRLAAVWTDLFCSYWSSSLPEEKLPWRKIDHTSSSSAEVKNKWSFTSDPPYAFRARTETNFTSLPSLRHPINVRCLFPR
jgi:hypothetical protein